MIEDPIMPLSALPYFLKISTAFCNAIDESMHFYESDQDQATFSKILDHLSTDLNYYLGVYQTWTKDPKAGQHQQDLDAFGAYLKDAQELLSSAVDLIRH
jgi:hypothetical protein